MARHARIVLQGVGRERLGAAGDRIRRARKALADETKIASLLLDPLLSSGLTATEAAQLLGVTRQTIYDLRQRGREDRDALERRLLAHLAGGGAAPVPGLAERAHADEDAVRAAIDVLKETGFVGPAVMQYKGGVPQEWVRVTDAGISALEEWVWRTDARPQLWTVYIPMLPDEREMLERVALDFFGSEWFAVIEPGTVRDQQNPELAFNVVAGSFKEAIEQGRIRAGELYEAAEITGGWAIRAVLPADTWHAEFGTGE